MGKPTTIPWTPDHALEAVCQASPAAIIGLDPQGTVHLWNPSAERIFGWQRHEVLGQQVKHVPPERWEELQDFLQRTLEGKAIRGVEVQRLRKDGSPVDLCLFAAPLRDSQGNIHGCLGILQHRLAQERVNRLHGLLEPILHSAREGIVGLDQAGNHTFVNPAAARMLGYEAAELLGRHAHSTWHHSRPDGSPSPEHECPVCATLYSGEVYHSAEDIYWRKDGTRFWVEFTCTPIMENGCPAGAVVTFRDITERKQAEEKLRTTRDQLQRLLSCSPAIIYSCRPGGKYGFTFISKNLTSFLGYEPREIMESPDFWLHHVHPQDRLRLMAALPSLEHQGSLSVEYRFRAKNGTWRWLEDDGKLVRDAQGTPLEVIGSWIDVTARKEAEKVIREAREYAESIIETLHEPLMVLDADLRVISANRAFYQTFQENPAETEGRFLYELGQRQWGIPKLRELLEEIIPNNSHLQDFEVQHYFPHLGRKEMLLNARRILREGEGTQLILLAIEDVTQHKQTEENLRRSLENLQRALGETTAALASAAEKRDPYTAGHQQRVAQLAGAIAREMGCTEDQMEAIRVAGILHDIGKLYVPSEILSKPTRLSDLEFAMIKTHSQVGFDILKEIKFPWPVAQIVLQHHERMNGSGYPHGLTSPDILPEARILAVADVVEAMASHRPYRPALGIQQALQEISRHRGILYDPQAVDACLRLFTERNFQFN